MTLRKLNLERLSSCNNEAHPTHSVAVKWKITGLGATAAPTPHTHANSCGAQGSPRVSGLKQNREPFHSPCFTCVDDDCESSLLKS